MKESEDEEEENNSSPVKRPASLMSGKKPPLVVNPVCSLAAESAQCGLCIYCIIVKYNRKTE